MIVSQNLLAMNQEMIPYVLANGGPKAFDRFEHEEEFKDLCDHIQFVVWPAQMYETPTRGEVIDYAAKITNQWSPPPEDAASYKRMRP